MRIVACAVFVSPGETQSTRMPESAERPLDGDRLGQRDDGRLGGAVGAATCRRVLGIDGTDERSNAARLPQRRVERSSDVERPGEVDRQRAVPVRRIDVEDRVERGDRGAVDHGIDSSSDDAASVTRRHRTRRRVDQRSPWIVRRPEVPALDAPALVEEPRWQRRPRCRSPRRSRRRAGVGALRLRPTRSSATAKRYQNRFQPRIRRLVHSTADDDRRRSRRRAASCRSIGHCTSATPSSTQRDYVSSR